MGEERQQLQNKCNLGDRTGKTHTQPEHVCEPSKQQLQGVGADCLLTVDNLCDSPVVFSLTKLDS